MCVMLYLTVLFLEFCPVIFEHPLFDRPVCHRIHTLLKKATIPLVVSGIVLSTLHQSSLGSLFLIAPYRVHPLWYSPIIWILFFVSAVGLGLMTIAAEALFSSWYFGHKLRIDLLGKLGKAASAVLFIYAGLRLGDLVMRGTIRHLFEGSREAFVFLLEISLAVLLPATLLLFRRIRASAGGLAACAALTILGMVGYRFNLCIVAFARPEGASYFPTWMEIAVSAGIVAAAGLVFIFFVENLKVCEAAHEGERPQPRPGYDPQSVRLLLPESLAGARRYSLALVAGAAAALAMLPRDVWRGSLFLRTATEAPRVLAAVVEQDNGAAGAPAYNIRLAGTRHSAGDSGTIQVFLIDGNRDGRLVPFPHRLHAERLGGDASCTVCHHQALPFDQNTPCHRCHRDMYLETDIFDHGSHASKLGGNSGCVRCHGPGTGAKTRAGSRPCGDCHQDMAVAGALIQPPQGGVRGYAPGYMNAMHGLCITCHKQKVDREPDRFRRAFTECGTCHRGIDGAELRRMTPYATAAKERSSAAVP